MPEAKSDSRCALDLVADMLSGWRPFRMLKVINEANREPPGIEAGPTADPCTEAGDRDARQAERSARRQRRRVRRVPRLIFLPRRRQPAKSGDQLCPGRGTLR